MERKRWSLSKENDTSFLSGVQSGNMTPDIVPAWDPTVSSSTLVFSSSKATVSRALDRPPPPSNAALYALSPIYGAVVSFSVSITAAEGRSSRPLTLGVASKSIDLQKLAAEGFGKCGASWGLQDDRSGSGECVVFAAGKRLGTFRRLRSGDIINFVLNVRDNWLDIVINFGEYKNRISLSPTLVQAATQTGDYVFGVSAYFMDNFICSNLSILFF